MFYFYGAKRAMARWYPDPEFPLVVEPFAGSAQYAMHALRHGKAERAVLYDSDPRVVEIWHRLLSMSPEDVLALPPIEAGVRTSDPMHIVVAASNSWGRVKGMTVTPRMAKRWETMKANIAAELPLVLGKVEIYLGDYTLAGIHGEATYFVDPPYQPQADDVWWRKGQGYPKGHDARSLDFVALGEWCRSRSGQVIVAEQDGATWLPFLPLRGLRDSQGTHRKEVIWTKENL